jgi:hypothetical protein
MEPKPTLAAADPVLARLVDLFNHVERAADAHALCSPDVVVHAYAAGKGGRREVFEGPAAVEGWVRRARVGKAVFSVLRAAPAGPHPDLPPGERAIAARYQVQATDFDFTNEGDWVLHARGDRLVALHHAPEPIPDELAPVRFAEGALAGAEGPESETGPDHEHE